MVNEGGLAQQACYITQANHKGDTCISPHLSRFNLYAQNMIQVQLLLRLISNSARYHKGTHFAVAHRSTQTTIIHNHITQHPLTHSLHSRPIKTGALHFSFQNRTSNMKNIFRSSGKNG